MAENEKEVLASLMSTIRAAGQLAAHDINFFRPLDQSLDRSAQHASGRLLDLINRVHHAVAPEMVSPITNIKSLNDNWKNMNGVLDSLLEKVDLAADAAMRGATTVGTSNTTSTSNPTKLLSESDGPEDKSKLKVKVKPQKQFKRRVDNTPGKPFKPLLTSKPHALIPFEKSIVLTEEPDESFIDFGSKPVNGDGEGKPHYIQPYRHEIQNRSYPTWMSEPKEPIPSKDWESTSAILVDTPDKLKDMIALLKESSEVAVDLEHHGLRSYLGLTCLMQISNRDQDWIIDTLALRDDLQPLNQVFADPNIVKVLHGAEGDIIWLQRDLGLYIVNLFDTYLAARALGEPKAGLATLLELYANFITSKKYQMADWRIRPLPANMMKYARADTHFLLNIFDQLRNKLIKQKKLNDVLDKSRTVAARRFEMPDYDSTQLFYNLIKDYRMTQQQEMVLRRLYAWRDDLARRFDESTGFIAPNRVLVNICLKMPTNVADLFAASPNGVPSFVRSAATELIKMILTAKAEFEHLAETPSETKKNASGRAKKETPGAVDNIASYTSRYEALVAKQSGLFDGMANMTLYTKAQSKKSVAFESATQKVPSKELQERAHRVNQLLKQSGLVPESAMDLESQSEGEPEIELEEAASEAAEAESVEASKLEPEVSKRKAESDQDEIRLDSKRKKSKKRKLKVVNDASEFDINSAGPSKHQDQSTASDSSQFNAFDFKSAPKVLQANKGRDKDKSKNNKEFAGASFKKARRFTGRPGAKSTSFKAKR